MRQLGLSGLSLATATHFDTFWPGPNQAAYAAARESATGSGEKIVFLHGPTGVGKTHLLKAAWRGAHERGVTCAYLSFDDAYMLDPDLIEGWGALDFVALDALERIAGYAAWERALFRLLEALRERGATWLAAGREPPDRLRLGLPDLASRLAWGPIYSMRLLDEADLAGLAVHVARTRGLELPAPVAQFLVTRLARDPEAISEAIDRLDEAALAAQRRLTIPFVRQVLFGPGVAE
jgi:DnaA-homolog protein